MLEFMFPGAKDANVTQERPQSSPDTPPQLRSLNLQRRTLSRTQCGYRKGNFGDRTQSPTVSCLGCQGSSSRIRLSLPTRGFRSTSNSERTTLSKFRCTLTGIRS